MLKSLRSFFKRFTGREVSEAKVEGMRHVFDNIDHNFDPGRPKPSHVHHDDDDEETRRRLKSD